MIRKAWLIFLWIFRFSLPLWAGSGIVVTLSVLIEMAAGISLGWGPWVGAVAVLAMTLGLIADFWRLASGRTFDRRRFHAWAGGDWPASPSRPASTDWSWRKRARFLALDIAVDVHLRRAPRRISSYVSPGTDPVRRR